MIIMTKCIPHHLHKRALAYSDNIYVYTMETDLSAHLRDVALVLADLEKNGITAKPSKSFFAMQRLRVIGLIVSKLGIQVNPDRLQAITEFQMPKSKTASPILLHPLAAQPIHDTRTEADISEMTASLRR